MAVGSDWDVPMSLEELEELDVIVDDEITIYPYPYPDDTPYEYTYDYLLNFSKISIEKYNQDTGKRYEFVELEEALMHCSIEFDRIKAYFKARRPGDVIVTTFEATTYCPRDRHLSDPHPESIVVFPFPDSAASSQNGDPAAENLELGTG